MLKTPTASKSLIVSLGLGGLTLDPALMDRYPISQGLILILADRTVSNNSVVINFLAKLLK